MKASIKKIVSLLLVCSLLIASLAACGGGNDETKAPETKAPDKTEAAGDKTDAPTDAPTEPAPAEPITITVGIDSLGNGFPETQDADFVRNMIFEKTNVWVDLIKIDDYYTALNVQLTGGTAPDFFYCNRENMVVYANQGLIQELTDWNDDIAAVYDRIGAHYDNYTLYVDGTQYAFPKAEAVSTSYFGLWMREDLLKDMNKEIPTTLDEYYDLCVEVKAADPTGLGTIPVSGRAWYPYNIIAGTYGVQLGNNVTIVDGKVSNTLLDENMPAALEALNKFYSAGLISTNTFNSGSGDIEIRKGQAFSGSCQWATILKQAYIDILHEVKADGKVIGIPLFESQVEGVETVFGTADYNSNSGSKVVANADTDEEKLAAYCRVINFLATEEGEMLSWMGVKGTHWDYDANGNAVVLEGQADKINYVHSYQLIGRNDPVYLQVKFPEANEFHQEYLPTLNRLEIYNGVLEVPDTYYLDDMETYANDQMLAFIKGERPISEYSKFVDELYNVYGLQTYIDIATEQLGEMGLLK